MYVRTYVCMCTVISHRPNSVIVGLTKGSVSLGYLDFLCNGLPTQIRFRFRPHENDYFHTE